MKDGGDSAFVIRDSGSEEFVSFALEGLRVQDTGLIDRTHMRHHQKPATTGAGHRSNHDIGCGAGRRFVPTYGHA